MRHRHGRATVYRRFDFTTLFACLGSLALALGITTWRRHHEWRDAFRRFERLTADYFAAELVPYLDSPAEAQAAMVRIAHRLDAKLALYDPSRNAVASSDGPLPLPDQDAFERARRDGIAFGKDDSSAGCSFRSISRMGDPVGSCKRFRCAQ